VNKARYYLYQAAEWLEKAETGPTDVHDGALFAAEQTAAATIAGVHANLSGLAFVAPHLFDDEDQADEQPAAYGDNWRGLIRAAPASSCGVLIGTERCGLLAGHAGRHLSWPSGHADPPYENDEDQPAPNPAGRYRRQLADARESIRLRDAAMERLNLDLRRRSDEADELRRQLADIDAGLVNVALAATRDPDVYELPGAPPTGRIVRPELGSTDAHGNPFVNAAIGFVRERDGKFYCCSLLKTEYGQHAYGDDAWTWAELLGEYNRLHLLPLTDEEQEQARLYGPPGERWGDLSQPCPYVQDIGDAAPATTPWGACFLRFGHIGPHVDGQGRPMGQTVADEDSPSSSAYHLRGSGPAGPDVTLADGRTVPTVHPDDACTCLNPGQHQPGCPRHRRMSGGTVGGE